MADTHQQRIIALLGKIPNISTDPDVRQALIAGAGLDAPLLRQIKFGDPAQTFLLLLISTLNSYGPLADGRHPIQAILESARSFLRPTSHPECDALLTEYGSVPPSGAAANEPFAAPRVSLSSLPVTSPDLVGREQELAALDAAWDDPRTNLFVLVAWGGVGKTSLVNTWLLNLGQENYRGAQRVFGWSFYSQGAGEGKQASADRFMADALRWFGDPNPDDGDPLDKARRLSALIKQTRTLLVLDGLEPLQYPPGSEEGRLKDRGLCALLRDLAIQNPGLCLITTRLPVNDLETFFNSTVHNLRLTHLSLQAGAQVLHNLGVQGAEAELQQAVQDFDGHALALNLLGTYLTAVYDGDVRQRDKVPHLVYDDERQGKHARRVMESYERWFAQTDKGRRELQILRLMGLFDRPADIAALEALLADPAIPGLTDDLKDGLHLSGGVHLNASPAWKFAIKDLQDLRLLATPSKMGSTSEVGSISDSTPSSTGHRNENASPHGGHLGGGPHEQLDCHPLVREHFSDKLRQQFPDAYIAAHSRLYDYYKNACKQEYPDTLEEMEPLFVAVAHGCLAGRHQEANDEIFFARIKRRNEYYVVKKLGALGSFLATLSNFFEELWSQPVAKLKDTTKAVVLNQTGYGLRAVGRLREAAQPMQASVDLYVGQENWEYAAMCAGNLSELWLTLGEVAQTVETARQSVAFADRSGDGFIKEVARTWLANALLQVGELSESERFFREAEDMQRKRTPNYPYRYSQSGFQFCDLLLSLGQYQEVQQRAAQMIKWENEGWMTLLDRALDRLSLGRTFLLQACPNIKWRASVDALAESLSPDNALLQQAADYLDQAVAGLREAGRQDHLPRALLARAALFRVLHDFDRAWADLHEAHEIAARGEMRLWLVDYHLEAARVCFAQAKGEGQKAQGTEDREQGTSSREQGASSKEQEARSREQEARNREQGAWEEMRGDVEKAAELIEATGYHRRDGELAALQDFVLNAY